MHSRHTHTAAALMAILLALSSCGLEKSNRNRSQRPGSRANPPPVVVVTRAIQTTVPLEIRTIGIVEAYSTVQVKAQIEGTLMTVHFKEGQDVKTSDVLFTIDPRPYIAALNQAQANLERDRIQAENARKAATRTTALYERKIASEEERDASAASAEALEATVRAEIAAIETAKVKLDYCTIRSPVVGRTGSLKVHAGNVVRSNDVLVTIVQISPIYVAFSVPEQALADVKKYMAIGPLKVIVSPTDDMSKPAVGELTFIENTVDVALGTIMLKAVFPNTDKALWPGQFVNAVMTLTQQPNVVVVPAQAVQTGQQNRYVFVVTDNSTVEERPVIVERTFDNQAIIAKGLKADERVVTDGLLRLAAGSAVEVLDETTSQTAVSRRSMQPQIHADEHGAAKPQPNNL